MWEGFSDKAAMAPAKPDDGALIPIKKTLGWKEVEKLELHMIGCDTHTLP